MKTKIISLFKQYNIKSISYDSRNAEIGNAFFAIKGEKFDGNLFISEALEKGAIVFTDCAEKETEKVFYVQDIRLALAIASGILYPKFPKNLIAVTGTNGKSSVVSYVYQILKLLGLDAATLGTLGLESTIDFFPNSTSGGNLCVDQALQSSSTLKYATVLRSVSPANSSSVTGLERSLIKINEPFLKNLPSLLTTPDPITFRKILNELNEIGIDNLAFEASSHGISQKRLGDIKVKTAGFTSFSQDHLDYHKTMEDYLKTKLQLFADNLEDGGEVVINSEILDSNYAQMTKDFLRENGIRYFSVGKTGDIKIKDIKTSLMGSEVYFEYGGKNYHFDTNIIGSFQAVNLLVAAKMVANLGLGFDQIIEVLKQVAAVTGRLQRIGDIEDEFQVFVDYAHTPDALKKSLSELQKIKLENGNLYVVFGCGGDRDPSKRGLMGEVACKLADYVVVTDDNPRSEDPKKIRFDVLKTASKAEEIDDRELAIENTMAKLQKNDILLIAGKGHEEYQIIGNKTLFFSDIEIAKNLLILKRKKLQ